MNRLLSRVLAGIACVAATVGEAQQPTFRSGVDVVSVDALVVDADGRPIDGLRPEDFDVTVDGQPRPLLSAQFVNLLRGQSTRRPDVSSNDIATSGRIVLLVIDRSNIRLGEGAAIMDGVARLVEKLSPYDRIGLYTIPLGGPKVDVTSDHQAVLSALRSVRGLEQRQGDPQIALTVTEALQIERTRPKVEPQLIERNCSGLGTRGNDDPSYLDQCRSRIVTEADLLVRDTRRRNEDALAHLGSLLEILRYVEGPKTVVFVSEGLAFDAQLRSRVKQFGSDIAASGTAFYAVQAYVPPMEAAMSGLRPDWEQDRVLRADGLSLITGVSGGALFRPPAGTGPTFEHIARELSARYVLAFQVSASERDGRPHRIDVRLKDGRARIVRHRTEFTADARPRTQTYRVETLIGALNEPLPLSALPVRVATYVTPEAVAAWKVIIAAEIGDATNDARKAQVAYEILDAAGMRIGKGEDAIERAAGASGHPLSFVTAVPLAPGRYRVKLAAKDEAGRLGSVEHPFVIDAPRESAPATSSLMLYRAVAAGGQAARPELIFDLPQHEPTFGAHIIVRDAPDAGGELSAVLEVNDAQGTTLFNSRMPVVGSSSPNQRDFELSVPSRGWGPGRYVAKATVVRGDQPVATATRTLMVREGPPPATSTTASRGAARMGTGGAADREGGRDVDALVTRASQYVAAYAENARNVVAEEAYVQAIVEEIAGTSPTAADEVLAWRDRGPRDRGPGVLARRQLRSDLLMVKTSTGWYTNYRDVSEVDGRPVKNREQRALELFAAGGTAGGNVGATLRRISEEGARYNLGRLRRTVNAPALPLFTLHPDHVGRFTFDAAGEETIDGTRVRVVAFRERRSPTFIMTADGEEVFTAGRLWIEPESGRVLRTQLDFDQVLAQLRVRLDVDYARVATLDLLMPSRMRERYVPLRPSPNSRTPVITGEARYTNFRIFKVESREEIR